MTILFALLAAITAGWENVDPARAEFPPAKVLWKADFSGLEDCRLELVGGAEADVSVSNATLVIEKKNDRGLVVVKSRAFKSGKGARMRISADVSVVAGDVESAHAMLRAVDAKGALPACHELYPARGAPQLYSGGREMMNGMVNSPPGMFYRKYGHWIADADDTVFAIVVGGTASVSVWKNWIAEDYDAAQEKWREATKGFVAKDRSGERLGEAEFDAMIAADSQHTAALRIVDGVTRLFIDGEMSPPVAYRAKGSFGKDALMETFSGRRVSRAGVRLMVRTINLGTGHPQRKYWSKAGFDAKGAAADIKNAMRIAPDALFMVGLSCNAYPEFTAEEHPEEAFVLKSGRKLVGNAGVTGSAAHDDMGIKDSGKRWPWVSFASVKWREAVKSNIRDLVAELKRTGLDKRIVGIHLCGYGDGQFYVGPVDYSAPAKAGYRDWLAGEGRVSTNYAFYAKCLALAAQNEFAGEFKRALGKDALAVIWCNAVFITTHYLGEFQRSAHLDVIVPQPFYSRRHPGIAAEVCMPWTSYNLHGKMLWTEFDLRTYGSLDTWAVSAVATKGLGHAADFGAWQSTYRKYAGVMIAARSGYWFYDMGAGWFDPPEIAADIAWSLEVQRELAAAKPSPWRPSVAVLFDEAGLIGWDGGTVPLNNYTHYLFPVQNRRLAESGVPFELFLAEDALADPSLLDGAKTVVFANFRKFDEKRIGLVKRLARGGRTLVFLAESGVLGGAEEGCGFKVGYSRADEPHAVVAEPGAGDFSSAVMHEAERDFAAGVWPIAPPKGPRGWIEETPGMKTLARYSDGKIAAAELGDASCRRIYVAEAAGLSPRFFNRLCRESGAYVPVAGGGLQVDMNGDFISVHALKNGRFEFLLPRPALVKNLRSRRYEAVDGLKLALELTAGETCWFRLEDPSPGR